MKYYNKETKKPVSEEEFASMSPEEKGRCVPWKGSKSKGGRGKPEYKSNDYDWYVVDDAISKAVANQPFNVFTGVHQFLTYRDQQQSTAITTQTSVPGVFGIRVILTYGESSTATSAMNVSAKALYTFVRHMNSGRTNYDSPDLMTYIMAMSQVYAAIAAAERDYEIAMTYRYENKDIPVGLASMINLDINDMQANLANFRYQLNMLIAKATALCIPKAFSIHKRHSLLMRNVFTDSDSLRGQFYIFYPAGWLQWSATAEETGSSLQYVPVSTDAKSGRRTSATIIKDIQNLLDVLIYDEDINIMSGDVLKAFGSGNLYELEMLDENSTASFVFNEDILQQIENSTCVAWESSLVTGDYKIFQTEDTNLITEQPPINPNGINMQDVFFNSHKNDPDYKDVMEWSRMMTMMSGDNTNITYGTELILDYAITGGGNTASIVRFTTCLQQTATTVAASITTTLIGRIESFDWHPILYLFRKNQADADYNFQTYIGDLKKAALLSFANVKAMNDAALMGTMNTLTLIKDAKNPVR